MVRIMLQVISCHFCFCVTFMIMGPILPNFFLVLLQRGILKPGEATPDVLERRECLRDQKVFFGMETEDLGVDLSVLSSFAIQHRPHSGLGMCIRVNLTLS